MQDLFSKNNALLTTYHFFSLYMDILDKITISKDACKKATVCNYFQVNSMLEFAGGP